MSKKISVLMGIYNCAETLSDAINSIISQTYNNWELIICDDASKDNSLLIAENFANKDNRIKIIYNSTNMGLNYTLNHCLKYASGDFIARQDGDDISLPERFEKQVEFLENNPEFMIVSTPMIFFDENGEWGQSKPIIEPTAFDVVCGSPICHAPVMMHKICMDKVDGYTVNKKMLRVEDVNLWIKLYAAGYKCKNLEKPLYKMRNDINALNRRKYIYRINSTYTRLLGCKLLNLSLKAYLLAFKPMIIGIIPAKLRQYIKRKISKG